jgi:hypothetical protein
MKKILWAISALAALSLASCQKDSTSPSSDLTATEAASTAVDADQVSTIYADMGTEVDQALTTLKSGTEVPDSTGNRHSEDHSGERKDKCLMKKISFSKWGFGMNKRWIKNGAIILIVSPDKLTDTVKFIGLTVNGKRVEGTRVTTRSADGNTKTVKLIDGKITFKDSTTYTCNSIQTWTRTAGAATPNFHWDDEWDITYTATGVNRKKVAYSDETTIPLHLKKLWPVYVSGETKKVVGKHTVVTNYGDGTNDFIITVTVDGNTKTVDLSQEDKK